MLHYANINSPQLAGIFGIRLGGIGNLLTLFQSLEAVCDNSGEVNENIVAAVVVRNEAEAFCGVKPFYCTLIHVVVPPKYKFVYRDELKFVQASFSIKKKNAHIFVNRKTMTYKKCEYNALSWIQG